MGTPSTRSVGSVVGWPSIRPDSLANPGMSPPTETRSATEPVPESWSARAAEVAVQHYGHRSRVIHNLADLGA